MKGDGALVHIKSKNSEDGHFLRQANLRFSANPDPIRRSLLARMRMAALICQNGNISYASYGFYLPLSLSLDTILTKEWIHPANLKATSKGG